MRPCLIAWAVLAWAGTAAALLCPPVGFDSAYGLDVARFFGGVWHVQLQVGGVAGGGTVWPGTPAPRLVVGRGRRRITGTAA